MRFGRYLIIAIASVILLAVIALPVLRYSKQHRSTETATIESKLLRPVVAAQNPPTETIHLIRGVGCRITTKRPITSATLSDESIASISVRAQTELVFTGRRKGRVSLTVQLEGEVDPVVYLLEIAEPRDSAPNPNNPVSQMTGMWHGEDWGFVELSIKSLAEGRCEGHWGGSTGRRYPITLMQLLTNPREFRGTWHEFVNDRGSVTLNLSPDGQTITGSWNATNLLSRPGGKSLGNLRWRRVEPNIDTANITTKRRPEETPAVWQIQHLVTKQGIAQRLILPYATEQIMLDDPSQFDMVQINDKEWWILGKRAGETSLRMYFGERVHPVKCVVTVLDRDPTDQSEKTPPAAAQQKPLFDIDIETVRLKQQFQLPKGTRIRVPLRDTVAALLVDDNELLEVHHSGRELLIEGKKVGQARVAVLFDLNGEPETYGVTVQDNGRTIEVGSDDSKASQPAQQADAPGEISRPVTNRNRATVTNPDQQHESSTPKSSPSRYQAAPQILITLRVFGVDQNKLRELGADNPTPVSDWLSADGPWCSRNGFTTVPTAIHVMTTQQINPLSFDVEGHDLSEAFPAVLFDTAEPKKKKSAKATIAMLGKPVRFDLGSVFNYWWSDSAEETKPSADAQFGKVTDLVVTPIVDQFGGLQFRVSCAERSIIKGPLNGALIPPRANVIRQYQITSDPANSIDNFFIAKLNANKEVTHVVQINTVYVSSAEAADGNEPADVPVADQRPSARSEDMNADRNLDRDMDRILSESPNQKTRPATESGSGVQANKLGIPEPINDEGPDNILKSDPPRAVQRTPASSSPKSSRSPTVSQADLAASARTNEAPRSMPPGTGGLDADSVEGIGVLVAKTEDGLAGFSYQKGTWTRLKLQPVPDNRMGNVTVWRDFAVYRGDPTWYAFDNLTGKWAELKLTPVDREKLVLTLGGGVGLAYNKRAVHAYVVGSGHWSTVRAPDGIDTEFKPLTGINGEAKVQFGTKLYVITKSSGEWTSPDQIDPRTPILQNDDKSNNWVTPVPNPITFDQGVLNDRDARTSPPFLVRAIPAQLPPQDAREREAARLAQQIRALQKPEPSPNETNQLTDLHRKLDEELKRAFDEKLNQEESQIQGLRSRLSQLERQIAERRLLRDKIINRRATELIEGDDTKWNRESVPVTREATPVPRTSSPNSSSRNTALPNRMEGSLAREPIINPATVDTLRERLRTNFAGMQNGEVQPAETLKLVKLLTEMAPTEETLKFWEILSKYFSKEAVENGALSPVDRALFDVEYAWAKERIQHPPGKTSRSATKEEGGVRQEITDAEIEVAIEKYHKRTAPMIEKLKSCQSRVRELEPVYYRDHSNTVELQQALDQLSDSRRDVVVEFKAAREELNPLDDRLFAIAVLAEEIYQATLGHRAKMIPRVAEGKATQAELRQVKEAETRTLAERDLANQRRQKIFDLIHADLPEEASDISQEVIRNFVADVPSNHVDDFIVPYWFETIQGLKVELVRFDGLNLPCKAALKVLESEDVFESGDMIIAMGYGQCFDNYSQIRKILKEHQQNKTVLTLIRGGLAGRLHYFAVGLGEFNVEPDSEHASFWRFEFRAQSNTGAPPRAVYLNGVAVSIDGLVAVPVTPDLLTERIEVNAISPWKSAAQVVHTDQEHGLMLLKISGGQPTKLFDWARYHNLSAAVGQKLLVYLANGTTLLPVNTECSSFDLQPQKPDSNSPYFYIKIPSIQDNDPQIFPKVSVVTIDEDHELQGLLLPLDPDPEKGWKCIEAKIVTKLVDEYRKKER